MLSLCFIFTFCICMYVLRVKRFKGQTTNVHSSRLSKEILCSCRVLCLFKSCGYDGSWLFVVYALGLPPVSRSLTFNNV
jgi:hypothetical protein